MSDFLGNILFHNLKTKGYALVVSLILWIVILGPRSLVVREVPVEYLVGPNTTVQDAVDKVKITISSKRSVLQRLNIESLSPIVDLRSLPPGSNRVPISMNSVNMPMGAELVRVDPDMVTLYLKVKTKAPTNNTLRDENGNEKDVE